MQKFLVLMLVIVVSCFSLTGCMTAGLAIIGAGMDMIDQSEETITVSIFPGKESVFQNAKSFSLTMNDQGYENQMLQEFASRGISINQNGDILIKGEMSTPQIRRVLINLRFIEMSSGETIGTASFDFHKANNDPGKIADAIIDAQGSHSSGVVAAK